ncbi:uncharacterized protein LOC119431058 [Dermacentor silvarum]|uniref:uncharacterized protein LOC119431058 n=1 Tax=Dermacentor silvarum TaxID=543639 RepID=UPI00189A736D|nr:uncharacterized protein LOC119431058 [Dermacentor silvarum]
MVSLRKVRCFHLLLILAVLATSRSRTHSSDGRGRSKQNTEELAQTGARDSGRRSVQDIEENENHKETSGEETRQKSITSHRKNTDDAALNIMQREAPLIRDVEAKIHEGKEAERNLTGIRDAIRREMSGVDGTDGAAHLRRLQMTKRLRELDQRIAELHAKNQEAQQRFRGFVGAIDAGDIRDENEARSALGSIYHFCGTVVAGAVRACRGVYKNVVSFFTDKVVGGIGDMFHSLLGSKWPSLKAGVNLLAGV